MRLFIGIVTHDRQNVLEFMLRFMHIGVTAEVRAATEIHVFENDTQMNSILVTRSVSEDIRPLGYNLLPHERPEDTVDARNADLGRARCEIIRTFMAHVQYTHCVILDDDMVVSLNTIWEAACDLDSLRDLGVATLTLHPFPKRLGPLRYQIGDSTFINHDFSGDNAWIIPKETIMRFGNVFGSGDGGYANNLWAAIKQARMTNITRLSPAYEIQHLGVQGLVGSIIYKNAPKKPGWTKQLFTDYLSKRVLHSELAMLWSAKGADALLDYVRRETKMTVDKQQQDQSVVDRAMMPKGKVEITIEDARSGQELRRLDVENLVVDNAKSIMARLLGSSDVADWAITKIIFGSGDTTPTESDVSLEVPLSPEKAITTDYPDDSSVRFTGVLESDEANGFPISEAALYSGSEGIFSRIVFGPLNKSADFRFVFRWTIYW